MWPRLAAIAERLWTNGAKLATHRSQQDNAAKNRNETAADAPAAAAAAMELRLRALRCLLLARGFGAGVVGDAVGDPSVPEWQRLHGPPGPGGCAQDTNKTAANQ
jgi:hypothetical protein